MRRKVALFGASFDPPTGLTGHGGIVAHLLTIFPEVWLVPVYQHPFITKRKRSLTSYENRLDMLHLQFKESTSLHIYEAEKEFYEYREQKLGLKGDELIFGTYDLIDYLKDIHLDKEIHFVMGGDTVKDLTQGKWRRHVEFIKNIPIVAINRFGYSIDDVDLNKFQAGIQILLIPELNDISSSHVRSLLARGENTDGLLHQAVIEYIKEHQLYKSSNSTPQL